jgi:hypothetical protein
LGQVLSVLVHGGRKGDEKLVIGVCHSQRQHTNFIKSRPISSKTTRGETHSWAEGWNQRFWGTTGSYCAQKGMKMRCGLMEQADREGLEMAKRESEK